MRTLLCAVPNVLTVFRIAIAPVIFIIILQHESWHELWNFLPYLLLLTFFTDFLDGYLSRKFNCVSRMGEILDPVADKILVVTLLFAAGCAGFLTFPGYVAVIIIIMREFIISGMREYGAQYGLVLPSTNLAKVKTIVQMTALICLLFEHHTILSEIVRLGEFLLICAAVVSFVTGLQYLQKAIRHNWGKE